jgi:hypothetical protein
VGNISFCIAQEDVLAFLASAAQQLGIELFR